MSNLITVHNDLPRMLTSHGGRATRKIRFDLKPGRNEVDADTFHDKAAHDVVLKHFVDGGQIWEEGTPAVRPAPTGESAPLAVHSEMRPEDQKPEPEPAPSTDPIKPTRMGGGVPGTVEEARALVAETEDPDRLHAWVDDEKRSRVKRALRARIAELSDGDNGDTK